MLHLDKWMAPLHCTPVPWFLYFILVCGLMVTAFYYVFGYGIHTRLREVLEKIVNKEFPKRLVTVFLRCGTAHLVHVISLSVWQYGKLTLLIVYPVLIWQMWLLLKASFEAAKKITEMTAENERLRKQNQSYKIEQRNRLNASIDEIFMGEDIKSWFYNSSLNGAVDDKGNFTHLSDEWEVALGWSVEEMKSRHFFDFIHEDDVERTKEAYSTNDRYSELHPNGFINRWRHKKGFYKYIYWPPKDAKIGVHALFSARIIDDPTIANILWTKTGADKWPITKK